jgi:hypothetical protein
MQKLLLLLLPLAIAACVERDTPATAQSSRVETYPSAPTSPSATTSTPLAPTAPSAGVPAQRTTLPGRGEGERESPAVNDVNDAAVEDMPDGSIDAPETSDEERNRAGSNDAAPSERGVDGNDRRIDPTNDPAIIDESGAGGFGGNVLSPETLGDGEVRPDDEEPLLPADVVDAGPAMIP